MVTTKPKYRLSCNQTSARQPESILDLVRKHGVLRDAWLGFPQSFPSVLLLLAGSARTRRRTFRERLAAHSETRAYTLSRLEVR